MDRRELIYTVGAASAGALLSDRWLRPLGEQMTTHRETAGTQEPQFEATEVEAADNRIFIRRYGKGPGLLMIHGFPRTSLMWRHVAPALASSYTVACVDLRGYGQSGSPRSTADHFPYSKRAMAQELVEAMSKLGFAEFAVVGHDRGGRVAYRLALDHPDNVTKLAVFDVIPILEAWKRSDARFAKTYWPWILLSQQEPLPESYLLGSPKAVFGNPFGQGSFDDDILEQYLRTFRDPQRVHAVCEEYRAAATIDVDHDKVDKDAGKKIECPMLHLWAEGGPLDHFYAKDGGALGIWREWAPRVQGQAMRGGHFFPEENPADTISLLTRFLQDDAIFL